MRIGKRLPALAALLAVVCLPAAGQERDHDEATEPQLKFELKLQDLFSSLGADDCRAAAEDAYDPGVTVFKRREAFLGLNDCVKRAQTQALQIAARGPAPEAAELQTTWNQIAARTEEDEQRVSAEVDFLNMSWGVGFGYSLGLDEIIEEAEIVNGIVRSTKDSTDRLRLVLEFHRYFKCNRGGTVGHRGCGPFVAVTAGEDDVITGIGTGWMFGWKTKNEEKSQGFSVGLGALFDADVKSLGPGFEANQPPPAGETEIRFEEKGRWSALLFFTRTF